MCISVLLSYPINWCLMRCFVGRGPDPADQAPVFDQGAFNGIAKKSLCFGGGEPSPYGMNEPFSVQQTDRKLAAGRRGHDISPTNCDNVKFQFIGLLTKADSLKYNFKIIPEGDTTSYI